LNPCFLLGNGTIIKKKINFLLCGHQDDESAFGRRIEGWGAIPLPDPIKSHFKKTPMNRNILILVLTLTYSISSGQTLTEQDDRKLIASGQTFFNDTIKKKESAAKDYIGFYQTYISGIRGQECPMYPSCSNYGMKTFGETNFASAFVMTSDRLLRCGHEHNNYSLTLRNNGFKSLDYPAYDKPPLELYYSRNSYYYAFSDTVKDDSTILFIKKLINNQYYQEALLEIMRSEFQLKTFSIDLFINKVICLKAIGDYEKALFEYDNKCPAEFKSNTELAFQVALIQYKLQNYDNALQSNSVALESCETIFCKPKIISLNGLIYASKYDWQSSIQSYKSLSLFESYELIANKNLELTEKAIRFKNKSASLAGILSIIPGAGYAYTGNKQTAISALIVNGLLAYATYTNLKNKNYGMGILTSVFNLSFYIGNIYGATKSANRFNDQQKKSIIDKLVFNSHF
jgi:putative component of membrane protein insertase Oxa1/YidC/SpoIIIJ protein YidD